MVNKETAILNEKNFSKSLANSFKDSPKSIKLQFLPALSQSSHENKKTYDLLKSQKPFKSPIFNSYKEKQEISEDQQKPSISALQRNSSKKKKESSDTDYSDSKKNNQIIKEFSLTGRKVKFKIQNKKKAFSVKNVNWRNIPVKNDTITHSSPNMYDASSNTRTFDITNRSKKSDSDSGDNCVLYADKDSSSNNFMLLTKLVNTSIHKTINSSIFSRHTGPQDRILDQNVVNIRNKPDKFGFFKTSARNTTLGMLNKLRR